MRFFFMRKIEASVPGHDTIYLIRMEIGSMVHHQLELEKIHSFECAHTSLDPIESVWLNRLVIAPYGMMKQYQSLRLPHRIYFERLSCLHRHSSLEIENGCQKYIQMKTVNGM